MFSRKLGIIEPHFDDAWLNLGGYILMHPEVLFKILTVSKCEHWNKINHTIQLEGVLPNVLTSALNYCSLSVSRDAHENGNLQHSIPELIDQEMQTKSVDSYHSLFLLNNGLKSNQPIVAKINEFMDDVESVFRPAGLYHPMHEVVSQLDVDKVRRIYTEFPYKFYSSVETKLQRLRQRHRAEIVNISGVLEQKVRIFESVYTSQQYVITDDVSPRRWQNLVEEEILIVEETNLCQ